MKFRSLIVAGFLLCLSSPSWAFYANPFTSTQVSKAQVITALNWVNDESYRKHGSLRNQIGLNAGEEEMYRAVLALALKEGGGTASISRSGLKNFKGMAEILSHALALHREAKNPDLYDCYYASEQVLNGPSSVSQMRSVLVGLLRFYQIIQLSSVTKADYNPENAARCDAGRKKALAGK